MNAVLNTFSFAVRINKPSTRIFQWNKHTEKNNTKLTINFYCQAVGDEPPFSHSCSTGRGWCLSITFRVRITFWGMCCWVMIVCLASPLGKCEVILFIWANYVICVIIPACEWWNPSKQLTGWERFRKWQIHIFTWLQCRGNIVNGFICGIREGFSSSTLQVNGILTCSVTHRRLA